jgi:hypothetical protein
MPSKRKKRHSKLLPIFYNLVMGLRKYRSTVDMKVENLDTTTGLPQWETVEPTVEPVQETVQQLNNEEAKVPSADAQPANNSNQVPPPGVSQVLLDSGMSNHTMILSLHC